MTARATPVTRRPPVAPKSLILLSPAKLNLYLEVTGKRPDGFHDILTLFERISLCDRIRLTPTMTDEIVLRCRGERVPCDAGNLAFRAAALIREACGVHQGVSLALEKNIPVGAGLAGGSSNAATVLCGLNKLFGLRLSQKDLVGLADRLGSDVAFFVLGERFAIGKGRGNELKPVSVPARVKLWHLLFLLPVQVLTKDIYGLLDRETARRMGLIPRADPRAFAREMKADRFLPGKEEESRPCRLRQRDRGASRSLQLTRKDPDVNMLISQIRKKDIVSLNQSIHNRLSETVMRSYGLVSELRDDLLNSGLRFVHMSGSGPTLFATFGTKAHAQKAQRTLEPRFSHRCRMVLACTQ